MDCPKCGRRMSWYVDGLIRPGAGTRTCPWCQTKLEVLNGHAGIMVNSVLLAAGFILVFLYQLPLTLLWLCLTGIGCWLLLPVWTKLFGKPVIWSYSGEQEAKAKWLAAESFASTITMAGWVLYMAITLLLPYGRILSELDSLDNETWKRMEEFTEMLQNRLFSTRGAIEIGVGILSFLWCQITLSMRALHRQRSVEDKIIRRQNKMESEEV